MERKKWTPKTEITESLLLFREKRKWQLALRRYVIERNTSPTYAHYFGLGIDKFREWIEIQFNGQLNWINFGTKWYFEHIVPVAYFNFSDENDCILCWNFINIKVQNTEEDKTRVHLIDLLALKSYFEGIYSKTGYTFCLKMIEKIGKIEASSIKINPLTEDFITKNKYYLDIVSSLSKEEFNHLNTGVSLENIILEREIIRKFS